MSPRAECPRDPDAHPHEPATDPVHISNTVHTPDADGPGGEVLDIAVLSHLHHPIGEPYLGGLEAHTAQACRALAERGHRVRLFAKQGSHVPHPGVEVVPMLEESFVWHPGVLADELAIDEATRRSCELAASSDVVLNNTLNPVPYTALPQAAMLTVLHTPATLERITAVVGQPAWRPGARHAWVSVSNANAAGWRDLLPVPVQVVHNGIDLARWPASTAAQHGLVWSARITPEKGLHEALDAIAGTSHDLTIAGPISDPAYFAAEIAPRLARLDGQARHVGHLDHARLAALLRRSAVFVCTPMWDEPFGLVALEAMASGTPVAALARGALPELLGATGGVCVGSSSDLAAGIESAARLPRPGVRQRAERFTMDAMVDSYERILTGLLTGPSNSPGPGGVTTMPRDRLALGVPSSEA